MRPNLLILGGTTEARDLCKTVSDARYQATVSLAGRVARPAPLGVPMRVGGFGGVAGLRHYLQEKKITHVIDVTHPFAARMSQNAITACIQTDTPLIALTRAPWRAMIGDNWTRVSDIAGAVAALAGPPKRVMLAVGRMHLDAFAIHPQHFYLLRLVDPPADALRFADAHVLVQRGPFTQQADTALMMQHRIDLVVSKNAGGTGAYAKIQAANALSLPVIMIDRPSIAARREAHSVGDVMEWLAHSATDLGV